MKYHTKQVSATVSGLGLRLNASLLGRDFDLLCATVKYSLSEGCRGVILKLSVRDIAPTKYDVICIHFKQHNYHMLHIII